MKAFLFALKHLLKNKVFLLFLCLTAVLPMLSGLAASRAALPPAAVYAEDPDAPDTARLIRCLREAGFRVEDSFESLRHGVSMEHYDAGVVVPADFPERLKTRDTEGIFTMVVSQSTSLEALWREHAGAALFQVYAPYLTASVLEDLHLEEEDLFREYYALTDGDPLFYFELETLDGRRPETGNIRAKSFFLGALSVLLFLTAFFGIAMPVLRESFRLGERLPLGRVISAFSVPAVLLRAALLLMAAVLSCLIAGHPETILPAVLSAAAMTLISIIPWLFRARSWQVILGAFVVLFSLALCPIFIDLSLFFKPAGVLRFFLPPYWLWLFGGLS